MSTLRNFYFIKSSFFLAQIIIIFLCLGPKNALADSVEDFYIQQALDRYFTLPNDARSLGTGGSTNMDCRGAICTFLNPAGLARLESHEVATSVSTRRVDGNEFLTGEEIEQIEDRGYVLLALSLGQSDSGSDYGTLAVGYSRYRGETNDRISSTPDGHRRTVAYGVNLNDAIDVGYTFTFYDDQLNSELADLHSHARFLHLFGARYAISDKTNVGSVFRLGIGQSDTEDYIIQSNGLSRPKEYGAEVGISTQLENFKHSAGFGYSYVKSEGDLAEVSSPQVVFGSNEKGEFFTLKSGVEYEFAGSYCARGGLRWYEAPSYRFERSDLSQLNGSLRGIGYSAGLGYTFKNSDTNTKYAVLDYGFDYLSAANGIWEHRVSLSVPF